MAAAIALDRERRPGHATPLALAVWACSGWVVASAFFGPVYTPAALFHPLFLLAGFALARGGAQVRERSLAALAAGALVLALWGLWQSATGQGRAAALFETPNTLASVLGLVLAPLLLRLAYRDGRRIVLLAIVLAAGLTATLSRGGFIALAAGLLVALLGFAERPDRAGVSRMLLVLGVGGALGLAAVSLPGWLAAQPPAREAGLAGVAATLPQSLGSRAELYRLALSALGEHPWLGAGYLGFRALLEAHRAEVPSYAAQNVTYFVHDDYLQTLIELGLPGLGALLAVVLLPFWLARRSRVAQAERRHLCAPLAGLAVMAIHALGDFPFYVPLCLLGFGALLGEVDARLATRSRTAPGAAGLPARLARIVAAAAAAVVLVPPALAEAAAAYGDRSWRAGEAQAGAFGFELARRLQRRDWRYDWYAGQFWHAQALAGNPAAPRLADAAFAAAVAANPREPRPLLARLATQLRFARLLDDPQPAATLRGWADRALALAPLNPAVRRDHDAALDRLARGR